MNETPEKTTKVPASYEPSADLSPLVTGRSPALQIMLDDRLFDRAKMMAGYMAKAEGFTPKHLIGKTEACFAVLTRALTWRLDPFAVACCTYQTPGGSIGYEGKLCQAILENSGKLEGPVRFHHYGDWSKVQGKFEKKRGSTGKEYAAPTWTDEDAAGLGVVVSAKIVGEPEQREWSFDLIQAYPRNSTLWATDPKTQICYTAVRRFGNVAAPGIFMGVPFDRDDYDDLRGPEHARDVTPVPSRPSREAYDQPWTLFDTAGDEVEFFVSPFDYAHALVKNIEANPEDAAAWREANDDCIERLASIGQSDLISSINMADMAAKGDEAETPPAKEEPKPEPEKKAAAKKDKEPAKEPPAKESAEEDTKATEPENAEDPSTAEPQAELAVTDTGPADTLITEVCTHASSSDLLAWQNQERTRAALGKLTKGERARVDKAVADRHELLAG